LVPSFAGGDDLVGVFCPNKALWVDIFVGDKAMDRILEVLDGTEDTTLETARPVGAP
jgi:hypothetical protein